MVENGTNFFRTLIEIRSIDKELGTASVVVRGWKKEAVDIPTGIIQPPELVEMVLKGGVLSAMFNLSAEKTEDLQLRDFLIPPPEVLEEQMDIYRESG